MKRYLEGLLFVVAVVWGVALLLHWAFGSELTRQKIVGFLIAALFIGALWPVLAKVLEGIDRMLGSGPRRRKK